ncbi:uncharacterized protein LOC121415229 [Lytechinus variegatus]|uniref:uncharacterized protein LOC121415229 n=1 Tax=Lytechinus variegatus TaxID=7654 RepID=UPI001BB23E05|nr:uncharacterized protein LOC121415229 [Lytechinus variegatus]
MAQPGSEEAAEDGFEIPQDLCERLENVELDEEETETLLQEALALNMRLKAELQRRENNDLEDSSNVTNSRGPQGHDVLSSDKHIKNSSARHRRPGQKKNPLPPISPSKGQTTGSGNHRKGGPLKSKGQPERRGASSPAPHAIIGRIVNSAGSVEGSQRRAKSAKKDLEGRPTRSAEQRKKKPEWNDRFSYK